VSVDTVLLILERLFGLGQAAVRAARAGDERAVQDILPELADYPDQRKLDQIQEDAAEDYGPPPNG